MLLGSGLCSPNTDNIHFCKSMATTDWRDAFRAIPWPLHGSCMLEELRDHCMGQHSPLAVFKYCSPYTADCEHPRLHSCHHGRSGVCLHCGIQFLTKWFDLQEILSYLWDVAHTSRICRSFFKHRQSYVYPTPQDFWSQHDSVWLI